MPSTKPTPTPAESARPDGGVVRTKRSPNGVSDKVIALRLLPAEHEEARRLSAQAGITAAKHCADLYRLGLAAMKAQAGKPFRAVGKRNGGCF